MPLNQGSFGPARVGHGDRCLSSSCGGGRLETRESSNARLAKDCLPSFPKRVNRIPPLQPARQHHRFRGSSYLSRRPRSHRGLRLGLRCAAFATVPAVVGPWLCPDDQQHRAEEEENRVEEPDEAVDAVEEACDRIRNLDIADW